MKTVLFFIALTALAINACSPVPGEVSATQPFTTPSEPAAAGAFALTSPVFGAGGAIPAKYGCIGQNISPPLSWAQPPAGTQTLALTLHDPDAPGGSFVHWVIYNIPAASRGLPEALAGDAQLPDGTLQGKNGAAATGYVGPCPPSGTHHYIFTLYALDTNLSQLSEGADQAGLLAAMQGHILGQVELMGTFSR